LILREANRLDFPLESYSTPASSRDLSRLTRVHSL
jgi:hypothetical protein